MHFNNSNIGFLLLLILGLSCPLKAFQIAPQPMLNVDYEAFVNRHQTDSIYGYIVRQENPVSTAKDSLFFKQEALPFLLENTTRKELQSGRWLVPLNLGKAWEKMYLIQLALMNNARDKALQLCEELEQESKDKNVLMKAYSLIISHLIAHQKGMQVHQYYTKAKALSAADHYPLWWGIKAQYKAYTGCFYQALAAYQQSYELLNAKTTIPYDKLFQIRYKQAELYAAISDPFKASSAALQALDLYASTYAINHEEHIKCRLFLVRSYQLQPDKDLEIVRCLRQVLAALSYLKPSRKKIFELETQLLLSQQFLAAGLLDSSAVYLQKIEQNKAHQKQLVYYQHLADFQLQNGQNNRSLQSDQKALDYCLRYYGRKHIQTATTYFRIAGHFMRQNAYSNAIDYLGQAFDANRYLSSSDSLLSLVLALKINQKRIEAMLQWYAQSKYNISLQKIKKLADYNQALLHQYYRTDISVLSPKLFRSVLEQSIEIEFLMYSRSNDMRHMKKAFSFAEWARQIEMLSSMRPNGQLTFAAIPPDLLTDRQENNFRQNWLKKKIQALEIQQDTTNIYWLNLLLKQTATQSMSIEAKLLRDFPAFLQWFALDSLTSVAAIQSKLAPQTALVHYFEGQETLFQFILLKDSFAFRKIVWDGYPSMITQYHKHFTDAQLIQHTYASGFKDFCLSSYEIYYKIMHHELFEKANRLILIPDGILQIIPFETLLTAVPLDSVHRLDFKNLEYIFKSKSIAYQHTASSCTVVSTAFQNSKQARILGMSARYELNNTPSFRAENIKSRRALLSPMPNANQQTDLLAQQFEGDFYTDKYATEYYFKKFASQYDVLHLALHTACSSATKEEGLFLAFSEDAYPKEDNFLNIKEVQSLKLKAGLTVLPFTQVEANNRASTQGIMSLSASFLYAGSEAVVYSLWANSSDFTPEILTGFYQQLQGAFPKDVALQKAKLDYLNQAEGIAAHPAYWASLIQLGRLDPLEISEPVIHIWWFVLPIAFIGFLGWWCLQALKQRRK